MPSEGSDYRVSSTYALNCPAGATTTLININDEGTVDQLSLYGVTAASAAALMNSELEFWVDGVMIFDCADEGLADLVEVVPFGIAVFNDVRGLLKWDSSNGQQGGFIHAPFLQIPFRTNFQIRVRNIDAAASVWNCILTYKRNYLSEYTFRIGQSVTKLANNLPAGGVNVALVDILDEGTIVSFQMAVTGVGGTAHNFTYSIERDGVIIYTSGAAQPNIAELTYLPWQVIPLTGHYQSWRGLYRQTGLTRSGFVDSPMFNLNFRNRLRVLFTNPDGVNAALIRNRVHYVRSFV